jgi:hypothetical protein
MRIEQLFRREKVSADQAKGEFVGVPKERAEFVLKLESLIPLNEGYYVGIYKFVDDKGNQVVHFASKDAPYSVGMKYKIRATVKRHSVYAGAKQTSILRLKKLEVIDESVLADNADDSWMDI